MSDNPKLEQEIRIAKPGPSSDDPQDVLLGDDDNRDLPESVRQLIARCMDGTEPKEFVPRPHHPEKLSARHVHICLLRAAGYRNAEIAGVMGLTSAGVSYVVNCEYGKKVVKAVMYTRGTKVIDIRTKLDEYASELADRLFEMSMMSEDLESVTKVGFGFLDRAGYGATQRTQALPATAPVTAQEHSLSRLANALEMSQAVDVSVMPTHVPSRPPDEAVQSPSADDAASHQSAPSASASSGPSGGLQTSEPAGFGSVRLTKVG